MLIRMKLLAAMFAMGLGVVLSVSGCFSRTVRFYEGPERPLEEVAELKWARLGHEDDAWVISVDHRTDDFQGGLLFGGTIRLLLLPGRHQVAIYAQVYTLSPRTVNGLVDLEAGHTYVSRTTVCPLFSRSNRRNSTVWLEDTTTGEAVLGTRYVYSD